VPLPSFEASSAGRSVASTPRNDGAPSPAAGAAKKARAGAVVAPVPPLATASGVPKVGADAKLFAPDTDWLPLRSRYPPASPPTSDTPSEAGTQREPSKRSTCAAAGTSVATGTPCSFATAGADSTPSRSPPHCVSASYLAPKRLQSAEER